MAVSAGGSRDPMRRGIEDLAPFSAFLELKGMNQTDSGSGPTLGELARGLEIIQASGPMDLRVRGIAYHSQAVRPGFLFVAISGTQQDGHAFVGQARERGAVAAVVERFLEDLPEGFAQLQVPSARVALARLSCAWYGHPASRLTLVGITGTNGKTTTAHILEAILKAAGHPVGVLGTIHYRYGERTLPAPNTTPESLDLQRMLREMADAGITHVVMEVTSHALDQERVLACPFRGAVFTNLTRDHLDYHAEMGAYLAAKTRLFQENLLSEANGGWAVLNIHDPASSEIRKSCGAKVIWFGEDPSADFRALRWDLGQDGTRMLIRHPEGELELTTCILGHHNVLNGLAACACAWAMGVKPDHWRTGLAALPCVPGRFEPLENDRGLTVLVDYAHTPDALERALASARSLARERLICVFGCGGNRDQGKRPLMAQAAARRCDLVVVTSDNPRGEPPSHIIRQVVSGFHGLPIAQISIPQGKVPERLPAYTVIEDRAKAIRQAIRFAKPGDLVLIAGKGHETVQIVGSQRIPFDDREVARKALAEVES